LKLDATLVYLERVGIARSLSTPSLTVLSGEEAVFQVGGEIPIQEDTKSDIRLKARHGSDLMPKGGENDHRRDMHLSSLVYSHQLRSIVGVVLGLRVRARLDSGHPLQMVSPVPRPV
jgi:hypothetical protein